MISSSSMSAKSDIGSPAPASDILPEESIPPETSTTCNNASDCAATERNWLPSPSPSAAPFTNLTIQSILGYIPIGDAPSNGITYGRKNGAWVAVTSSSGTVTSVSGTSPISVANGSSTPAVSISQATTSTDGYLSATDWNTFNNKQPSGTYVTNVTGTSPVVSSGGTTPAISIPAANATTNGYLTSADWTTFNSKQPAGTYVTSVTGTAPIVSSGGTTPAISMAAATSSVNGYLTSTDWSTFNGKQAALVSGTSIKTVNGTSLLGSGDVGVGVTSITAGTGLSGGTITGTGTVALANTAAACLNVGVCK